MNESIPPAVPIGRKSFLAKSAGALAALALAPFVSMGCKRRARALLCSSQHLSADGKTFQLVGSVTGDGEDVYRMFERHMDGFTWAKKLSGEVKYKMARGMTAEEIRTMPQIAWPVLRIEFDCTCIEFDCTFEIRA